MLVGTASESFEVAPSLLREGSLLAMAPTFQAFFKGDRLIDPGKLADAGEAKGATIIRVARGEGPEMVLRNATFYIACDTNVKRAVEAT